MIRLVTGEELSQFTQFCAYNPFGCKIDGLQRAYGLALPFARFWLQFSPEGIPTAALSFLDGAMVLHGTKGQDSQELLSFLSMAGCRTLLCEESTTLALGIKPTRQGEIFQISPQPGFLYENKGETCQPPLRQVFTLLCDCGELHPNQFEAFYLDASHRVRHGAAIIQGILFHGKLAACAMANSITEHTAVLSAVAVHPDFRRQGLGSQAVKVLMNSLSSKQIFVLCATREAQDFYSSLSFSHSGSWCETDWHKTGMPL